LNICLPALTPHIIHEKQKAHAARIWMVAAISVASGTFLFFSGISSIRAFLPKSQALFFLRLANNC
jgi:hypothetical protein